MTLPAARRFALIAQLTHEYNAAAGGRVLGKKALQKLVYAFQRRAKEARIYAFSFYNYGVYSRDLDRDVSDAARYGFVEVDFDDVSNAYRISTGQNFRADSKLLPHAYEARYCKDLFGKTGRELELITTIMFVCDEERITDTATIVNRVRELKPKFSKREVHEHVIPEYCACATS
jgi:uncharacterized protein YwgA